MAEIKTRIVDGEVSYAEECLDCKWSEAEEIYGELMCTNPNDCTAVLPNSVCLYRRCKEHAEEITKELFKEETQEEKVARLEKHFDWLHVRYGVGHHQTRVEEIHHSA